MLRHFSSPYLLIQPLQQSPPMIPSFTSANFYLTVLPHYNSYWHPLPLYLSPFSPPYLYKSFPLSWPFSQFRQHQDPNEQVILVWTGTVFISPCFLKVWTGITVVTITDSLLFRLRKLVYCWQEPLKKIPSSIPTVYYCYFHTPPNTITSCLAATTLSQV